MKKKTYVSCISLIFFTLVVSGLGMNYKLNLRATICQIWTRPIKKRLKAINTQKCSHLFFFLSQILFEFTFRDSFYQNYNDLMLHNSL